MTNSQFGKAAGLAQRQILQAIEDVLVERGVDEMLWATDRGTFIWRRRPVIDAKSDSKLSRLFPKP